MFLKAHSCKTKYVSYTRLGLGCTYVSISPFVKTKYVSYTKQGLGCTCFKKPIREKQNAFHAQNLD
jgi:hypothetical protein